LRHGFTLTEIKPSFRKGVYWDIIDMQLIS
jgi:hypothetical protein